MLRKDNQYQKFHKIIITNRMIKVLPFDSNNSPQIRIFRYNQWWKIGIIKTFSTKIVPFKTQSGIPAIMVEEQCTPS